jgi:hypothetical protein
VRSFPFSLTDGTMALAWLVEIVRRDGQAFRFTTAQSNVVTAGVTFYAEPGVEVSSVEFRGDGSVANAAIRIATYSGGLIAAADVAAGLFGAAALKVYIARL